MTKHMERYRPQHTLTQIPQSSLYKLSKKGMKLLDCTLGNIRNSSKPLLSSNYTLLTWPSLICESPKSGLRCNFYPCLRCHARLIFIQLSHILFPIFPFFTLTLLCRFIPLFISTFIEVSNSRIKLLSE